MAVNADLEHLAALVRFLQCELTTPSLLRCLEGSLSVQPARQEWGAS